MRVIRLKKHWSSEDSTLVVNDRMTECGLAAYWRAVNSTFQFNSEKREIYLVKKLGQKGQNTGSDDLQSSSHRRKTKFNKDPLPNFFERRRYVENHRDSHEDDRYYEGGRMGPQEDFGVRRQNNCFLLPRLKNQF